MKRLVLAIALLAAPAQAETGYLIFTRDYPPAQLENLRDSLEGMQGVTSVTLGPIVTTADYERRLEVAKDLENQLSAVMAAYATDAGPAGVSVSLTPAVNLTIQTGQPDVRQFATVVVAAGTPAAQKLRIKRAAQLAQVSGSPAVLDLILVVPANPTDYLARRRVHLLATAYIQSQIGNMGDLLQPPQP